MNNKITYRQVISRLEENQFPYGVLTLQNGVMLVISEFGGRVFGPFLSPESESLFWLNDIFAGPGEFKTFLGSGNWNLGGERFWIAPEIQYFVTDRTRYWATLKLSPQMDPGQNKLDQPGPGEWRLRQQVILEAHLASGQKTLQVERLIHQVEDPLRCLGNYRELVEEVTFAGYEQVASLAENERNEIMSEAWNIVQLNPGGVLLIPATPYVEPSNYYEPVDDSLQTIQSHYVSLKITGSRQYKVGYKAAYVFGRLAYFNHLDNDRAYLIVRNFFNNPSAPYLEEPPHLPGQYGDSIHIYNDDGNFGGFGELECHGQAIGGMTGRSSSTDQTVLWLYVGAPDRVKKIVTYLLGIEL
jgi:hypothetical protein